MAREKKLGVERKNKPEREDRLARSRSFFLKVGGREGIRTPGLLVANGESLKLRRVATIS
jgi:hypothetical protein